MDEMSDYRHRLTEDITKDFDTGKMKWTVAKSCQIYRASVVNFFRTSVVNIYLEDVK